MQLAPVTIARRTDDTARLAQVADATAELVKPYLDEMRGLHTQLAAGDSSQLGHKQLAAALLGTAASAPLKDALYGANPLQLTGDPAKYVQESYQLLRRSVSTLSSITHVPSAAKDLVSQAYGEAFWSLKFLQAAQGTAKPPYAPH